MCRIDDTIKMEETPKNEANLVNFPPHIREDEYNLLTPSKESQENE